MGDYYKGSTPWLIPAISGELKQIFYDNCKIEELKRGMPLSNKLKRSEKLEESSLVYLKTGLLCQAFEINDPNKPIAMSLTLPERAVGYMNYIGREGSNEQIRVSALRDSEIMIMPILKLKSIISDNHALDMSIMKYCVACIESDKDAFLTLITRSVENRMKILIISMLEACELALMPGWNKLPVKLTHEEFSRIVYTAIETINRLLPRWKKLGYYKTENSAAYINSQLFDILER